MLNAKGIRIKRLTSCISLLRLCLSYSYLDLGDQDILKDFTNCFPNICLVAVKGHPKHYIVVAPGSIRFLVRLQTHTLAVDTSFDLNFLRFIPTIRMLEINLKIESLEDFHTVRCYVKRAADWMKNGQEKKLEREVRLLLDEFICTPDDLAKGGCLKDEGILSQSDPFYTYESGDYTYTSGFIENSTLPFFDGFEDRVLSMSYIATTDDVVDDSYCGGLISFLH
ncbi:unnamed protein product [Ambrosiozyma monospora]|uniref:Unnamed protein product n=1 Tax=Ambrosiozyma monospora TaxID=43982 RepID=A0ACB5TYM7_AMBMO|nr:unnamed protein product [Ambrosiozyma monospora]